MHRHRRLGSNNVPCPHYKLLTNPSKIKLILSFNCNELNKVRSINFSNYEFYVISKTPIVEGICAGSNEVSISVKTYEHDFTSCAEHSLG